MAREHARIKLSIWDDDQFRELSPPAQHLYFVLLSHNKLDYAGVTDWRPARLAGFSASWTAEAVEIAAQELSEQQYIVIDEDTEEVLIRSFVRNDEFMDQPNMAVAMRKAHRAVASSVLRGVIVHELIRLHADKPALKGWSRVTDMLDMPSVDPSTRAPFQASLNPSGKGEPNPSRNPSVTPSPTTAPNSLTQLPAPSTTRTVGQDLVEERPETLRAVPATEPPKNNHPDEDEHCTRHPDGNPTNEPCRGCQRVEERKRLRAEKAELAIREAAQRARETCPDCHGGVWLDDGSKCDHPKTRRAS